MKKIFKNVAALLLFVAAFSACTQAPTQHTCQQGICPSVYENLPFKMESVKQPTFPDYQVSVVDFGAKGDGITLNTEAINKAITAVSEKGGGKVVIPEGIWYTGPIVLKSNVNLHAEANAIISASRRDMIGATLYLVGREANGQLYKDAMCCSMCKRQIINAGIDKVVIRSGEKEYRTIPVSDWIENDDSLSGTFGY